MCICVYTFKHNTDMVVLIQVSSLEEDTHDLKERNTSSLSSLQGECDQHNYTTCNGFVDGSFTCTCFYIMIVPSLPLLIIVLIFVTFVDLLCQKLIIPLCAYAQPSYVFGHVYLCMYVCMHTYILDIQAVWGLTA